MVLVSATNAPVLLLGALGRVAQRLICIGNVRWDSRIGNQNNNNKKGALYLRSRFPRIVKGGISLRAYEQHRYVGSRLASLFVGHVAPPGAKFAQHWGGLARLTRGLAADPIEGEQAKLSTRSHQNEKIK